MAGFDYVRENARMAVSAGVFGVSNATFLPPLAPHPVPVTPKNYAILVIQFWQKNIDTIFQGMQRQVRDGVHGTLERELLKKLRATQNGGPLMVNEWDRILETRNAKVISDGFVWRMAQAATDAAREALMAFARGIQNLRPDEDGTGENLPPGEAAAFWSGFAKLAVVAENAEAEVVEVSLTDEFIRSAKERAREGGEFLGDAAKKTAEVAGVVIREAGEIAGQGVAGILTGLGIVPIAIGAAAVYVGVKVI